MEPLCMVTGPDWLAINNYHGQTTLLREENRWDYLAPAFFDLHTG